MSDEPYSVDDLGEVRPSVPESTDAHSEENLQDTLGGVSCFRSTTDQQLTRDPHQTDQQRHRDVKISELLDEYTSSYKEKRKFREEKRKALFSLCTTIIGGAAIMFGLVLLKMIFAPRGMVVADVVAFVTACGSFLTLVIGLMQIITKYCFPENDEEYITKIVQSIQENDLQHKLANIDYKKKRESENSPEK